MKKKPSRLRDRLSRLKKAGGVSSTEHQRRVKIVPSKEEAKEILQSLLDNETFIADDAFMKRYNGISKIIVSEPGKASLPVIRLNQDEGTFEYLGQTLMVGAEKATCHKFQLVKADGFSMLLDEDGDQVAFTFYISNKDKKKGVGFTAKSLKHRSAKGKLSLEFVEKGWVLRICPSAIEEWVLGCDIQQGRLKLTLPKGVVKGVPWGLEYVDIEENDDNSIPEDMSNPS